MKTIALAGNPNCGKTTVFNQLTGMSQKVGNYAGVTVERRSGIARFNGERVSVIDLPGTYSLVARARDEAVAFEVLTGHAEARPDLVLLVLDASNLERNLYLASIVLELALPTVVALNMIDLAGEAGMSIDVEALGAQLGVPVVAVVAPRAEGFDRLEAAVAAGLAKAQIPQPPHLSVSEDVEHAIETISSTLSEEQTPKRARAHWHLSASAMLRLAREPGAVPVAESELEALVHALDPKAVLSRALIEARHAWARGITSIVVTRDAVTTDRSERLDRVLLHPAWGLLVFAAVMFTVFQSIFAWAEPIMGLIEGATALAQGGVRALLPQGAIADLLADGMIGGVGNVLVFLPQIAILFAFIALLEDSGYLARAALIADRLMAAVGLHGRAFVPLLSGFACAVPAIMSTRSIENTKDRLVTILVAPLVSCSARLPVYALIIGTLFSGSAKVFGFLSLGGLMLIVLYALSVVFTVAVAFVLKRTVLRSPTPPLILELPPYRRPHLGAVMRRVVQRCRVFVQDAGTVILACSMILWALLYFPRHPTDPARDQQAQAVAAQIRALDANDPRRAPLVKQRAALRAANDADQLAGSFAGRIGRMLEPAIAPLGYDWKIGIGLLASFAAREVFVSTLGLIYGIGEADEESTSLRQALRAERDPRTGEHVYTPLVGLSLMVFFLLACQCMSTVAIVRRETRSWRWPIFMVAYMTALAWLVAFVVYQGGRALGMT